MVTGYTPDNTGNDSINLPLSQTRAQSVKTICLAKVFQVVVLMRKVLVLQTLLQAIAPLAGREQNRRVEISIYAKQ